MADPRTNRFYRTAEDANETDRLRESLRIADEEIERLRAKIITADAMYRRRLAENKKLRALIESHPGAAAGSREFDWVMKAKGWLTDHPARLAFDEGRRDA